jgi:hypothetical protein
MFRTQNPRRAVVLAILSGVFAAGVAASAMAESKWAKEHPRRHEVNDRLANQDKRIHNQVNHGEMSKAQARKLHKEDHQIRQEERDMASQNGGHITKQEQHVLNQQENAVSKQIGR